MRLFILLALTTFTCICKKKRVSEYTEADWDRIADEWAKEENEEDKREMEKLYENPGFKFDPNVKLDPEQMMAQSKKNKPTMVFFTVKEEFSRNQNELKKITSRWGDALLNGNVPVQNYPVAENRAIFMVQDGSLSYEIKNFLLKQPEIDNVSIDQQVWTPDSKEPAYPGQKPDRKDKKVPVDKDTKNAKDSIDNFFKDDGKSPKPISENERDDDIVDNRTEL